MHHHKKRKKEKNSETIFTPTPNQEGCLGRDYLFFPSDSENSEEDTEYLTDEDSIEDYIGHLEDIRALSEEEFAAQRRYQKTRYRVNNLITPDELIVAFKRNGYQEYRTTTSHNFQYSVFGCLPAEWAAFLNIHEVASRFKMVEFLSGSLTLYFLITSIIQGCRKYQVH